MHNLNFYEVVKIVRFKLKTQNEPLNKFYKMLFKLQSIQCIGQMTSVHRFRGLNSNHTHT